MKNWTIGKTIGVSFFALALILIGSILLSIWQVTTTATISQRAIELRAPTARASVLLQNGVNYSLAALRGWMILGKPGMKEQRVEAWKEIDESLAAMDVYSKNWTNPENIKRLAEMKGLFKDFKGFQQEIEDIANTPDNLPANKILLTEAAPKANILVANITKIIDIEANLPATKARKDLLGMMADVRGTTARSLANIRAFLLSGEPVFKERFDEMWTKNIKRFGDLDRSRNLLNGEQLRLFNEFKEAREAFKDLPPKMFEIRGSEEWNLANSWLGTKAAPTAGKIMTILKGMVENQEKLLATDSELAKQKTSTLLVVQWVLLAVGVAFSLFLGLVVLRNLNTLMNALTTTIGELSGTSAQLTQASSQVSSASQNLATGSSEQAAALEEVSSTLEEISSMTKQNASNTENANVLSAESAEIVREGMVAVEKMLEAIKDIKASSDQTANIIKTIDEIAFQTNLLALNAAVEAARAGEAGRGFAVVAEEVRNLAMRSAEAARDTSQLIEDSQTKADAGVKVSGEVGGALTQINEAISKVSEIISAVTTASTEQNNGLIQVTSAMSQLDGVTQSNAANAEQTAAASEQLSSQSIQVKGAVDVLSALVGGKEANGGTAMLTASGGSTGQKHVASLAAPGSLKSKLKQEFNNTSGGYEADFKAQYGEVEFSDIKD